MNNTGQGADAPKEGSAGVQQDIPAAPDIQKLWAAAAPYVEKMADAVIPAIERSARHTGKVTGSLLALIILSFTGLAALSLTLGRIDTAEKIVIALVSFLGGAAMFSGPPKK